MSQNLYVLPPMDFSITSEEAVRNACKSVEDLLSTIDTDLDSVTSIEVNSKNVALFTQQEVNVNVALKQAKTRLSLITNNAIVVGLDQSMFATIDKVNAHIHNTDIKSRNVFLHSQFLNMGQL